MAEQDEQAIAEFSRLLMEARGRIFGFIHSMVHNSVDAEDIYQQTTIVLWTKFHEFQPGTSFLNWALAIAQYKIKKFYEKVSRDRLWFNERLISLMAESYGDPVPSDGESERMAGLLQCLEKLPMRHRRLLQLRYASGMTIRALAQHEEKTEAAITMSLSRLRRSLLECIGLMIRKGQTDV